MNASRAWVSVCVVVGLLAGTASALNMETVTVGNPGNVADDTGYGAVGHEYNIGKYEVTAGQYCEFLNAVAKSDPYGLYNSSMDSNSIGCQITRNGTDGNYTYDFSGGTVEAPGSTAADWQNRPVNWVSWGDAARFANWLHNNQPPGAQGLSTTEDGAYFLNGATSDADLLAVTREADWKWAITSEDEWYKAAYHKNDGVTGNYFDFPTGNNSTPSRDMTEATNPGNNANYEGSPYPIDSPYYTTVAREFELSDSPYDTFDQGGNVWEWNEAVLYGSSRGLRGGSFGGYDVYLRASFRHYNYPSVESSYYGFRVAQVPEPTTLSLLAVGGLALLRRRRQ